ncbi:SulP family inorganic anion transporter [Streptomyces sp. NPDC008122]|uniref:SulP family inorganic anion transporter n=1 Tax=Streptomyces sp. NPDC008122 TaxID=3364810 RepID=UPI0036E68879
MRIRVPRPKLGRPKPSDVTSGMVTGLFSIPEGMAYASIAGFNPVAGLYTGVVPPILGSLTAPTVLMITTLNDHHPDQCDRPHRAERARGRRA